MQEKSISMSQEKILNNGLLFNVIRKDKPPEEKIQKILKYLDRGADINATDANDNNNTPLHIAVLKSDLQVITFLLQRGANDTIKNNEGQTALDTAILKNSNESIVQLLRENTNKNSNQLQVQNSSDENLRKNDQIVIAEKQNAVKKTGGLCEYTKRQGTTGLTGQLYETKLLCLILFRALHDDNISELHLASNMANLGAFDDIVCKIKYNKEGDQRTKIFFLQAKHKDDPTKDKVTVEKLLKEDGDFSLNKYLESYINIIQKFNSGNNDDIIFMEQLENVDCDFIIYTPSIESVNRKEILNQPVGENIIETKTDGAVTFKFQANDEDMKVLMTTLTKSRARLIAETLSKFILKGTYANMLSDNIIKAYHVYLAQQIISLHVEGIESDSPYLVGVFRKEFLKTNDNHLLLMRNTFYKILKRTSDTIHTKGEVEHALKSVSFKLPANFGNLSFHMNGNEMTKQKKLKQLCEHLIMLFENAYIKDSKYIVEINENINNSSQTLPNFFLKTYLSKLVGNLLIFDDETKMLKFNTQEHELGGDSLRLFVQLKTSLSQTSLSQRELSQYRLDMKNCCFPKLSLVQEEEDKKLVADFLNKLTFYTNQSKEDEVETIIKDEIDTKMSKHDDLLSQVKSDAIFLKFHDRIQKWWKQSKSVPFLTKLNEFYDEAICDTLGNPLLETLSYIFKKRIKFPLNVFTVSTLEQLKIAEFLKMDNKIMAVVSNQISLSSIKFIQYFGSANNISYVILDLERVISENYLGTIEKELKVTKCQVLVFIYKIGKTDTFESILGAVVKVFQGKIIIITNNDVTEIVKQVTSETVFVNIDNKNRFFDLEVDIRRKVCSEGKLIFQGEEESIGDLLTLMAAVLTPNMILQILNDEAITVGKMIKTETSSELYVRQGLCRYITFDSNKKQKNTDLYFINNQGFKDVKPHEQCDLVIITESEQIFHEISKNYGDRNVHWFREGDCGSLIWFKSKGSLETLIKYVNKGLQRDYNLLPGTLLDINEKLVIISGEPGMGKSTLLSQLAAQTKKEYPKLWVSKINFLDHVKLFSKWKDNKTTINLKEAFKFLYSAIDIKVLRENDQVAEQLQDIVGDRVVIEKNEVYILLNNDNVTDETMDMFDIHLFNHCYNNNQVVLLFDGFDEICPDYLDVAIQLLSTLKSSKVANLWVSSRPYNILTELECAFGTFSYRLYPFARYEQIQYLQKIWTAKLGLNNEMIAETSNCVNNLYHCFIKPALESLNTLMGIPLYVYMIAEVLTDYLIVYDNQILIDIDERQHEFYNALKLCTLYENFVYKKHFEIRFGTKKSFNISKDPDLQKIFGDVFKFSLDNHRKVGAYTLLGKVVLEELSSEKEIRDVADFMNAIRSGQEKTGIIECVLGADPKFFHLTFAEYFAMEYIFHKLNSASCSSDGGWLLWCYIIHDIFVNYNKKGIRKFIESKLEINQNLFDSAFYKYHSDTVFKILSGMISETPFFVLVNEDFDFILMFLLNCTKPAINKNNLVSFIKLFNHKGICVICRAVDYKKIEVVEFLLKLIKDVDISKIGEIFDCSENPLIVALYDCICGETTDMVFILLDAIQHDDDLLVDIFTRLNSNNKNFAPLASILGSKFAALEVTYKYLERLSNERILKIFTATDVTGRRPAHYAAESNNYSFFTYIEILLGDEELRKICMTKDQSGKTPICYMNYDPYPFGFLRYLLEKVYNENITDVGDFVFNKLHQKIL